jgi:hypothetical protein
MRPSSHYFTATLLLIVSVIMNVAYAQSRNAAYSDSRTPHRCPPSDGRVCKYIFNTCRSEKESECQRGYVCCNHPTCGTTCVIPLQTQTMK